MEYVEGDYEKEVARLNALPRQTEEERIIFEKGWDELDPPFEDDKHLEVTDERFGIKQHYCMLYPEVLKCRICGGTLFEIGHKNHFTVIRCPVCKWEDCIHDG